MQPLTRGPEADETEHLVPKYFRYRVLIGNPSLIARSARGRPSGTLGSHTLRSPLGLEMGRRGRARHAVPRPR